MKFRVWQLLVNRYRSITCNQVRVFLSACVLNINSGKIPCSSKKEQLITGYSAVIMLPWICQSFDQMMYGPTMSLSPSPSPSASKHWILVRIKPILFYRYYEILRSLLYTLNLIIHLSLETRLCSVSLFLRFLLFWFTTYFE